MKKFKDEVLPHLSVLGLFIVVACFYYQKTFQGYVHREDDVVQGILKGAELEKYTDADGDFPGWTNSIFSGMPSTIIKGRPSHNAVKNLNYLTPIKTTEYPFQILLLSFIGFYLLTNAFRIKPLYGALAAMAYGFATYSISSVEAAHYTKVLAMALMPALLASLQWLFNGRYLLGGATLAFNMALQVYFFHYQITFYSIICMLAFGIYHLIRLIKEKNYKQLVIATMISVVGVGAGVLSNLTKIGTTSKFAEATMRGGNDLANAKSNKQGNGTGKSGLERDYAFAWSYSKGETFTLLIPSFYGGSSGEKVSEKSAIYEKTQSDEALAQGWPLYHGDMNSTSGPIYVGAIIVFLFFLGAVVVKDNIKWPLIVLTLVSFILGWGRNFPAVNNFLFDHLKYFDKFRTPMMAFCIAQVTMPLLGFLGIKQLYESWKEKRASSANSKPTAGAKVGSPASGQSDDEKTWKMVLYTYFAVGGFCLLMALAGSAFVDFGSPNDAKYIKDYGFGPYMDAIRQDRASLLRADAFRSFIYISLAFGLFWAWYNDKIKKNLAVGIMAGLAVIDLVGVDWRYLGWDQFTYEKGTATKPEPDNADKALMADKDIHFRVLDLTKDPFNDNTRAAFHKLIGGYDPAKLSRYQDLISEMIADREVSDKALDMLNCKYLIGRGQNDQPAIQPRTTNNGNAWFVSQLAPAGDALLEMNLLKASDNKKVATYNSSFDANKGLVAAEFQTDSTATAQLVKYHPDTMVYQTSNPNKGYLVFSEIYYDDWKAEVDGQPVVINKVDYTLRGIPVEAGNHKIRLYFDKGKTTNDNIEKYTSMLILIMMGVMVILWLKSYFSAEKKA